MKEKTGAEIRARICFVLCQNQAGFPPPAAHPGQLQAKGRRGTESPPAPGGQVLLPSAARRPWPWEVSLASLGLVLTKLSCCSETEQLYMISPDIFM